MTENSPISDPKQRFSNRAEDYARYRPGYPPQIVDLLRTICAFRPEHVVADIGSGTGLLSRIFLDHGNHVFGVEPNPEMRAAGEIFLRAYSKFVSVDGSAEATTLAPESIDFAAAAQAFHWFDPLAARREFQRILKIRGYVVILWNERLLHETPFLRDYEALLRRFGTDYSKVHESYPRPEQMRAFFGPNEFAWRTLPNAQEFDFNGLSGRLRSSSYVPALGQPDFALMMDELRRVFDAHQQNGRVRMEYRTHVYTGKLDSIA